MSTKKCINRADLNEIVPEDMEFGIFYLKDGKMLVISESGIEIKAQNECDLFPVTGVKEIKKIESETTISILGSDYKIKVIGDAYYKIPIPPLEH